MLIPIEIPLETREIITNMHLPIVRTFYVRIAKKPGRVTRLDLLFCVVEKYPILTLKIVSHIPGLSLPPLKVLDDTTALNSYKECKI
jgi:hypothetical protein